MTIRIFNPDHDLALAANQERFTAPHAGRKLRSDLSFLPAIWSDEGDIVIVEDIDEAELSYSKMRFSPKPKVEFCTMEQIPAILKSCDFENTQNRCLALDAWGWNSSVCFQLAKNGIPHELMPTEKELQVIRQLSNRRFSADILAKLHKNDNERICGEASYITDINLFKDELLKLNNTCVVKAPWSCSGRGVRYFIGCNDSENTFTNTINWVANVIAQQGGIMIEPYYNKVKDFAVEFKLANNGKVHPVGYSLFDTKNGAYTGNLLATEEEKCEILARYVDIPLLENVIDNICKLTEQYISVLASSCVDIHFGVDMMVVAKNDGDGFLLHPCVEINLRRTMGLAALSLSPLNKYNKKIMSIDFKSKKYHLGIRNINQE